MRCYEVANLLELIDRDQLQLLMTGVAAEVGLPAALVLRNGDGWVHVETQGVHGPPFRRCFPINSKANSVGRAQDDQPAVALLRNPTAESQAPSCDVPLSDLCVPLVVGV